VRISVAEAAKIMGTTSLTIQQMMKQGMINIGDVMRNKERNTYIIHSGILARHIGVTEDELLNQLGKRKEYYGAIKDI